MAPKSCKSKEHSNVAKTTVNKTGDISSTPKTRRKRQIKIIGGSENIELNNIAITKYIYSITGGAFSQLSVTLREGQKVMTDGGSLAFIREGVEKGSMSANSGAAGAVGRWLAGESLIFGKYVGKSEVEYNDDARTVTFAASIPGEINTLTLSPGEEFVTSRGAFLASSPNIKVTGKLNWRGIFEIGQEEGFILPRIKCDPNSQYDATVWLSGYSRGQK